MPDNFAQLVKQQADIVKIIGDYVRLRKSGAQNYTGLCPFHKEKTGSFSVNAAHGYFYCFGCHEKGDVFTFVMKLENIPFPEAVRNIAQKAGVPLPKREFSSPEEAREAGIRRHLIDLHEAATQYFQQALQSPEAARAREYLTGRGVTPDTIKTFRLGYAPDDFNHMRDALRPHFQEDAMRASGLFSAKEQADGTQGQMYARFRKRITFPIANEAGKVIAFTARALDDTDDKGRPIAKYMNSPETPLFSKGHLLFNLDKAKADMRSHDFALLVEGQMDCISVYMAGIRNVLATSGTAFTEHQVRLLSRFTHRVVVNFDPDQAGATAAEKSIALLTEEGFEVKVVALDGGLDPDRFVRERGMEAYMAALRGAKRHADYLIDRARQLFPARTPEAKVKAMNFLLPHIRLIPHEIQRMEFAREIGDRLGLDHALFNQEIKQAALKRTSALALRDDEWSSETTNFVLRALAIPPGSAISDYVREEFINNPQLYANSSAEMLIQALLNSPSGVSAIDAVSDEYSTKLLAHALTVAQPLSKRDVEGAILTLKRRWMQRRQRELRLLLNEAEKRSDLNSVHQLMKEKLSMDRDLRALREG